MSRADIENALKAALASALPSLPKAWPNQSFDPKAAGNLPYIACSLIFSPPSDVTLAGTAPRVSGLLIATVVVEAGTSTSTANRYSDAIAEAFPSGRVLDLPTTRLRVTGHPHIREGMTDGAYWRVPVRVPFAAF